MSIFKPLNQVNNNYGGKALGLKKLIDAGLNVPKGVSISAEDLLKIVKQLNKKDIKKIVNYFFLRNLPFNKYINIFEGDIVRKIFHIWE